MYRLARISLRSKRRKYRAGEKKPGNNRAGCRRNPPMGLAAAEVFYPVIESGKNPPCSSPRFSFHGQSPFEMQYMMGDALAGGFKSIHSSARDVHNGLTDTNRFVGRCADTP